MPRFPGFPPIPIYPQLGRRSTDPWTPLVLGNVAAWWDTRVGITTVAGPRVSDWADQSGNGRVATQSNNSLRPDYQADHGDGAPALGFRSADGTRLAHAPVTSIPGGDFTVIWLFKRTGATAFVWSQSRSTNNTAYTLVGMLSGGQGYCATYSDDSSTAVERNSANTIGAADWGIVTARRQGDVFGVRINEGAEATVSDPGGACTVDQAFIGLLMLQAAPNTPLDGFVREGLIFDAYKSDPDQVLVRQYIRDKWPSI
jgi:hypothetical protein